MKPMAKGIATGMAVAATMAVVGTMLVKKKSSSGSMKKSAGKALHAAGNFIENMPKW